MRSRLAAAACAALVLALASAAPAAAGQTLAVQPDGKILVAGSTPLFSGYLARLDPDGTPDPGFGVGGVVVDHELGGIVAMAVQPDGRILALSQYQVARYEPDGRPDPSFGEGGHVLIDVLLNSPQELLLLGDGRIVVGGGIVHKLFPSEAILEILSADGERETTTGAGLGTWMAGMALRDDGSLVMAGGGEERNYGKGLLARFVPGSFPDYGRGYDTIPYPGPERGYDKSFGGAGLVFFAYPRTGSGGFRAGAVAAADAGTFVAGGVRGRLALARFGDDGVLDRGFGLEGFAAFDAGRDAFAEAGDLAVTADGGTVVVGSVRPRRGHLYRSRPGAPVAARFLPGGRLDPDFGRGGVARLPGVAGSRGAEGDDLELLPGGKILIGGVAGKDEARKVLGRLRPDGTVDRGFGAGGVVRFAPCGGSRPAQRRNGCLPSGEAELRLRRTPRGIALHLDAEPVGDWVGIGSLRLRLPPSLRVRRPSAAKAEFVLPEGKKPERVAAEVDGWTLRFEGPGFGGADRVRLDLPAGALRRVPHPAGRGGLRFRVGIGFLLFPYGEVDEQTMVLPRAG